MSMGCLSVFIAREPVSHLLTGQSMYTFSVLSERKQGKCLSYMGWERDRAWCLGGLWDIAMVAL